MSHYKLHVGSSEKTNSRRNLLARSFSKSLRLDRNNAADVHTAKQVSFSTLHDIQETHQERGWYSIWGLSAPTYIILPGCSDDGSQARIACSAVSL